MYYFHSLERRSVWEKPPELIEYEAALAAEQGSQEVKAPEPEPAAANKESAVEEPEAPTNVAGPCLSC